MKPHRIEGAVKGELTTACSGRRFAPPLMLSDAVDARSTRSHRIGRRLATAIHMPVSGSQNPLASAHHADRTVLRIITSRSAAAIMRTPLIRRPLARTFDDLNLREGYEIITSDLE